MSLPWANAISPSSTMYNPMVELIPPTMNGILWVKPGYRDAMRIFLFSGPGEVAAVLCMKDFGFSKRSVM
ncbi:hypothetical protein N7489_007472 [Penicillium chrysogenum]|uniref:uncharacterized protein n=1 Tax=Penicillium chrysogenum TaxID=5076 RepID=UPI00239506CA|nr:uncharacterized protein N7489_007472 [Penicillium chrysogenum]KAJ5237381.1 hypothetical protein N7489_007472 [Penicillium chrysogenum]KAJ5277339.1 hypothetical protein N7524_003492 [Penicillium chrysogenum]